MKALTIWQPLLDQVRTNWKAARDRGRLGPEAA